MASKKPSKEAGDDPSKDKEHQTLDEGDIKLLQSYASTQAAAHERGAGSTAGALHLGHGVPCACHLSPQGGATRVRCWGGGLGRACPASCAAHRACTTACAPRVVFVQGAGPYNAAIKKLEGDIVAEMKKVNELIGTCVARGGWRGSYHQRSR
jgi:hypothetical protein